MINAIDVIHLTILFQFDINGYMLPTMLQYDISSYLLLIVNGGSSLPSAPPHPLHCSPPPLMFGNKGHYLSLSCRCNSPILAMFIYGMSFMSYSNMLFCSIILYYIMQFLQAVRMLVLHLYCKLPKISFLHLYFLNTGQESEYYFMVWYK